MKTVTLALMVLLSALLLSGCASWDPQQTDGAEYKQTRDGYYRVKKGDSLHAIAFRFGLDWRDIASWNSIRSPYVIYPDQELRVSEPQGQASSRSTKSNTSVSVAPAKSPGTSQSRDLPAKTSTTAATSKPAEPVSSTPPPPKAQVPKSQEPKSQQSQPRPTSTPPPDPGQWVWPVEGRLLSTFKANDPTRNGIDIAGKEGQAIIAAAGGEVVYSGNGLISYGELIIIKHSDRLLSAYGHNRRRLVKEGDVVRGGQQIAEMGRNDRNQTVLHFEVRTNGAPQDPLKFLPKR